jgi:hypothetical protein
MKKNKNLKSSILIIICLLLVANLMVMFFVLTRKFNNQVVGPKEQQVEKEVIPTTESVNKAEEVLSENFVKKADCDVGRFKDSLDDMKNYNYPENKAILITLDRNHLRNGEEIPYKGVNFDDFILYGINSPDMESVDITWDGDGVVEKIPEVNFGVSGWCYKITNQKAKVGLNSYHVNFHPADGEVPSDREAIKYDFSINWIKIKSSDDEVVSLDMEWVPELIELDVRNIFTYEFLSSYNHDYLSKEDYSKLFKIYKSGVVLTSGKYQDYEYLVLVRNCDDMCDKESYYRVLYSKKNNEMVYLSKYSEEIHAKEDQFLTIANSITINGLETPNKIAILNSSLKFLLKKDPFLLFNTYTEPQKLFSYDEKHFIYKDNNTGCFIVRVNDGTAHEYSFDLVLDDLAEKEGSSNFSGITPYLLNFVLLDGSKNKEEYIYKNNGHYAGSCYIYANYIKDVSQLEKIGQTINGDFIYSLKDVTLLEDGTKTSLLQNIYNNYYPGWDADTLKDLEKMSFEDFLNYNPLIYWQDPFGNFVEFKNAKFLPAVEMGKPVIYLYPEKEMDVSVRVKPNGGFSLTEPEYGERWLVRAKPNGEIYNYGDNKKYPYLFWEGKGVNYLRPEKGFVVAKKEVEQFLQEKLIKLGLVQNEIDEFMEFWLPKMQDKNYYFITFVEKNIFDQIAPLNISPKPDTIIRVFMDYEGLDSVVQVEEPEIVTPKRKGFTVVEWGGALR